MQEHCIRPHSLYWTEVIENLVQSPPPPILDQYANADVGRKLGNLIMCDDVR